MPGYSGTPLPKKLGIKPGGRLMTVNAPRNYRQLVSPLPAGAMLTARLDETVDISHVFVTQKADLVRFLKDVMKKMRPDAAVWVSWPKKASKVPSDITEDTIREVALPLGLVDIKVCAVDETWSGLKLVVRKENR
jgi:DUF3052 family protein